MQGYIQHRTIKRNLPATIGLNLGELDVNQEVVCIEITTAPDGNWMRLEDNSWVKAKDIHITRDLEYQYIATANGLYAFDLQLFAELNATTPVATNNLPDPPDCFGQNDKRKKRDDPGLKYTRAGMNMLMDKTLGRKNRKLGKAISAFVSDKQSPWNEKQSFGQALGAIGFGGLIGGGVFGTALKSTNIGNLLKGNWGAFFNDVLGNALDILFDKLMDKISYVVGFDVMAFLGEFFSLYDELHAPRSYARYENLQENGTDDYWHFGRRRGDWYDGVGKGAYSPYTWADYLASMYFVYLGCDGAMITKHENGFTWVQDAFYSTPLMETKLRNGTNDYSTGLFESRRNAEEVAYNQEIYNNMYEDFEDHLNAVRESMNLNYNRLDWFINFNRWRNTHPDYHLPSTKAFVFITRPDLNLFEGGATDKMNTAIAGTSDAAFFATAIKRHQFLSYSLTTPYSGTHDFIPLITNAVTSMDVADSSIETKEYGETLTGWKIVYGDNLIKSQTAGTFTMGFTEDNKLSISFLHYIWLKYIDGVARGIFRPKDMYMDMKIIDYASSVYYFLTDQSGEDLLFWTKYYGVFPTNYPSSVFGFNGGTPLKLPEINIQYAYSFKEDMNPLALAEFNNNSAHDGNYTFAPAYNEKTLRGDISMVGAPFISTEDGGYTFKLRFQQRDVDE